MTGSPAERADPDPVEEGLAIAVGLPVLNPDGTSSGATVDALACAECGVLLWDVEAHWTDAHSHRLQALRAIAARG